jgi:uncharacterized glyoxalase superfamily protein PhnB
VSFFNKGTLFIGDSDIRYVTERAQETGLSIVAPLGNLEWGSFHCVVAL